MSEGLNIDLRQGAEEPQDSRSFLMRVFDWFREVITSWGPPILIVLVIRSILAEPFQIPSASMVPTLAVGDFILVSKFSYGLRVPFTNTEIVPLDEPARGDIIVFIHPPTQSKDEWCWAKRMGYMLSMGQWGHQREACSTDYIKRIVGLPGDTVEVRDDVVYLNGVEQKRTQDGTFTYTDANSGCRGDELELWDEQLGDRPHPVLQSKSYMGGMADYGPRTVPDGEYFVMGDNRDNSADSRVWGFVPRENVRGKAVLVWLSFDRCKGNVPALGSPRFERIGMMLK